MARKRARGAPKNERIGRKRTGKLASGRQALVVGAVCLAVLFLWPRLGTLGAKVPSSLVAVIVGVIMVPLFGMNVSTIGDLYTINAGLPELHVPQLSIDLLRDQLPNVEGGVRREGGLERASEPNAKGGRAQRCPTAKEGSFSRAPNIRPLRLVPS